MTFLSLKNDTRKLKKVKKNFGEQFNWLPLAIMKVTDTKIAEGMDLIPGSGSVPKCHGFPTLVGTVHILFLIPRRNTSSFRCECRSLVK
jgi:hypothetical protein